ncbi:mitochondrial ribosomal protein S25-domain-containing protein [Blastocladiella britannica]|nr:mitochondrial ribosomal protein S25-domain-containing protein [Blastocladiella britannica]
MPKAVPVYNNVQRLYQHGLIPKLPAWHTAMRQAPPSTPLPRSVVFTNVSGSQPFEERLGRAAAAHYEQQMRSLFKPASTSRRSNALKHQKKYRKLTPQAIVYPEDKLRMRFYRDHPFELVRAQTLVEESGTVAPADYSTPLADRASVSGEDVIQHQMYLISEGMTVDEAYDHVLLAFHSVRMREEAAAREATAAKAAEAGKNSQSAPPGEGMPSVRTSARDLLAEKYPVNFAAWQAEDEALFKNVEHRRLLQATLKANQEQGQAM